MTFIDFLTNSLREFPSIKQRPVLFGLCVLLCGLFHFLVAGGYLLLALNAPLVLALGLAEIIFFGFIALQGTLVCFVGLRLMRK